MLKKTTTDESILPLHSSADQLDYHIPVLLQETIEGLAVKADGVYVDCTFGGGGHSKALLARLGEKGVLVAFDQDEDVRKNLPNDSRVIFVPQNFRHLQRFLRLNKITQVDGILADLGVSSHQFDKAERGFSIRFEAALDMRMDQRQKTTAADILKQFTELQLHKMLEQYGEVTNAKTLAKTIVQQRVLMPIKTIQQLMGALKELLQQTPGLLKSGGRVAIITFHSLEDRLVKNFFKTGSFSEEVVDELYGGKPESQFKILSKKPILPTDIETRRNKRSRSAKLRLIEKK
jgi:16S rRNA (cytosine1402-N4)-methyltransferase